MLVLLVQVDVEQCPTPYSHGSRWRSEPSPGLRKSRVCSPELDLIHQGGREGTVGATGEISTGGAGPESPPPSQPGTLEEESSSSAGRCVSEFSPEQDRQLGDVEEEKEGRSGRFSLLC
ncbi:unnamed protein product [Boreogadus saida]